MPLIPAMIDVIQSRPSTPDGTAMSRRGLRVSDRLHGHREPSLVSDSNELIAAGILHCPVEAGDPFEDWPDIRLPPGTAAELIDADRGEASCSTTPIRQEGGGGPSGPWAQTIPVR